MKPGVTYDNTNRPNIEVLKIRQATTADSVENGIDYVAECRHDTMKFSFPIKLPNIIKQRIFKIDTVDNLYRKIVLPNNSLTGFTGIYLRKLDGFDPSMNSYLALSMGARKLTDSQQKLVLDIFKTGRHK